MKQTSNETMLSRKKGIGKCKWEENETNLGDKFVDGSVEELDWVAGMPFAVPFFESKLHEVASDRSDDHITRLASNGVVELENLVVARATIANS